MRHDLAVLGEYVVLANTSSGWFAVFENTLQAQTAAAKKHGRVGPNLIVYRTRRQSVEPRDHYVVPFEIFTTLVTNETVATAKVSTSRRWNLTLRDDRLRVTHGAGAVDVSRFYRAPLLGESGEPQPSGSSPAPALELQSAEAMEGLAREYRVVTRSRSRTLREAALRSSAGICEACGVDYAALLDGLGSRVLQVHHKNQLAHSSTEVVTSLLDLAVVCANCHSLLHASRDRLLPIEEFRALWDRSRGDT